MLIACFPNQVVLESDLTEANEFAMSDCLVMSQEHAQADHDASMKEASNSLN